MVPLFRYVLNQGADQKWTLTTLASLMPAIPVEEVSSTLLEKLTADMEISENVAIRSSLIIEILTVRWTKKRQSENTDKAFHQTVYEPLLPLFQDPSPSSNTWQNVQRYLYPKLGSIRSPTGTVFLQYLESLQHGGVLSQTAIFKCWVTIASANVQNRTLGIREIDQKRLAQATSHAEAGVRLKAFQICSQNEDLFCQKGIDGLKAGFVYNSNLATVG